MGPETTAGWHRRRVVVADDPVTGGDLGFDRYELDSGRSGPVVVVLGGVHGDELAGIMAAGRLCATEIGLSCGTLRVVPVCNEDAFRAGSREAPVDGVNLARVFPGSAGGSASERLAAAITAEVLADADLLIDLHSAGRRYDMPLYAGCLADGTAGGEESVRAAGAFGAPVVWLHPQYSPGRSTSVLVARDKPAVYIESPGGECVDPAIVRRYVDGVLGVLGEWGMLPAALQRPLATTEPLLVTGSGNLDRSVIRFTAGGVFLREACAGGTVEPGARLGVVQDPLGRVLDEPRSEDGGVVMFLRRASLVRAGDVVACLAQPAERPC